MPNQTISQFSTGSPVDDGFLAGYLSVSEGGNAKFSIMSIYGYILSKLEVETNQVTLKTVLVDTLLTVEGSLVSEGGRTLNTVVLTSNGPHTLLASNDVAIITPISPGASSVILPAASSGTIGRRFIVKDGLGDAGTNNITIATVGGNIDGAITYTINTNYGKVTVVDGGGDYFTI